MFRTTPLRSLQYGVSLLVLAENIILMSMVRRREMKNERAPCSVDTEADYLLAKAPANNINIISYINMGV